jgi:hypothetical protein
MSTPNQAIAIPNMGRGASQSLTWLENRYLEHKEQAAEHDSLFAMPCAPNVKSPDDSLRQ